MRYSRWTVDGSFSYRIKPPFRPPCTLVRENSECYVVKDTNVRNLGVALLPRRRGGKGELKYRAARFIRHCPQPAIMGVDDRPANRQPHPCSAGLCGVERIENAIDLFRID